MVTGTKREVLNIAAAYGAAHSRIMVEEYSRKPMKQEYSRKTLVSINTQKQIAHYDLLLLLRSAEPGPVHLLKEVNQRKREDAPTERRDKRPQRHHESERNSQSLPTRQTPSSVIPLPRENSPPPIAHSSPGSSPHSAGCISSPHPARSGFQRMYTATEQANNGTCGAMIDIMERIWITAVATLKVNSSIVTADVFR